MSPRGIEPLPKDPESLILSVKLRRQKRRVQDLNLCLPYGRTVFGTVALSHSANPPPLKLRRAMPSFSSTSQVYPIRRNVRHSEVEVRSRTESNCHQKIRNLLFYPLNYGSFLGQKLRFFPNDTSYMVSRRVLTRDQTFATVINYSTMRNLSVLELFYYLKGV